MLNQKQHTVEREKQKKNNANLNKGPVISAASRGSHDVYVIYQVLFQNVHNDIHFAVTCVGGQLHVSWEFITSLSLSSYFVDGIAPVFNIYSESYPFCTHTYIEWIASNWNPKRDGRKRPRMKVRKKLVEPKKLIDAYAHEFFYVFTDKDGCLFFISLFLDYFLKWLNAILLFL